MLNKALVLGCLLMIGMNLSVSALSESKKALTQKSSSQKSALQAVAQNKPSKAELQKCIKEARQYIANLRKMGYSTEEISRVVAEQIGVTAGLSSDFYEGHVTTQKMWMLLASAVVISSAFGGIGVIAGFLGNRILGVYIEELEKARQMQRWNARFGGL